MQRGTSNEKPTSLTTAADGLQARVVRSLEGLQPYETAWNQLALDCPQLWAGLSYAWIVSYLETLLEPGESWCCVLATEGDQLVGVLPVIIEPYSFLGLYRPRLCTPRKWDSYSIDFVAARGRYREIVPLLLETLCREHPNLFCLRLHELSELSPTLALAKGRINHFIAYQERTAPAAYIPITQSFQAHYAALGHEHRYSLARAKKKLDKLPAVKTVFLQGQQAARWEFGKFLDLEASGWKGRKGSAVKSKPAVTRFYEKLLARLGELGWLEWHLLLSEDHLLAGHLGIKMNRKLIFLKTTYDEAFAHCAPGKLLFGRMLERVFASGDTEEVDCLGNAAWFEHWGVQKRAFYHLWFYPRQFLPLTRGLLAKRATARLRQMSRWLPFHRVPPASPALNTS